MKKRIQSLATVTLTVIGFALLPKAEAVSPPPDGGYPGGNTAIGAGALLSNTFGPDNTAGGAFALLSNTTGDSNTAMGARALLSNTDGSGNTAVGTYALRFNTTG